jgi:hypothetical protein
VVPAGRARIRIFPSLNVTTKLWPVARLVAVSVNLTSRSPTSTTYVESWKVPSSPTVIVQV